jgi:hypothetical protein
MAIQNYVHEGSVLTGDLTIQGEAVGTLTKRILTAAALVNTTAAAIPATVHLVPKGGVIGPATCLISARTIAAGETYFCPELINQGLKEGGTVQALGAGLTFRHAGRDIVNG